MPIKINLTKADIIANTIHKTAQKGDTNFGDDDTKWKALAVILTSFASSQSWQTSKELDNGTCAFNKPEIKEEHQQARDGRWKSLSTQDISEIGKKDISDQAFENWLVFNVGKPDHKLYKSVWNEFKETMLCSCDDVGERE